MMDRREFIVGTSTILAHSLWKPAVAEGGLKVRRNLATLDPADDFFDDFADAITAMHGLAANDPRSWRGQSLIHADYCPHGLFDFFAWHRLYITYFESICAELIGKDDFALPYWDWTKDNGRLPAPFFEDGPLNVEHWNDPTNYNSQIWGIVRTVPGRLITAGYGVGEDPRRGGAFTDQSIASIMVLSDWDMFRRRLEGSPHNNGHTISGGRRYHVGGGMSPLDPMFWLHHCNVDRLWAKWQTAGNHTPSISQVYDGQFSDADGQSVETDADEATDFENLGFTYDELIPEFLTGNDRFLFETLSANPPVHREFIDPGFTRRLTEASNDRKSIPLAETRIDIPTEGLIDALDSSRKFNAYNVPFINRTASEPSRILAEIEIAEEDGDTSGLLANIFVNCDYLSPETPTDDEHFADSFSFFGLPMGGRRNVLVDLTGPLRTQAGEGRIGKDIALQIMPVPVEPEDESKVAFLAGSVRLIRT